MGAGIAPAQTVEQLRDPITNMATSQASGWTLIVGLVGAVWSASGYVGAFGRAMNRIWEIDEGRPIWKLRPILLVLTLVSVLIVALLLLGLVVSGPIAEQATRMLGLGSVGHTVFNIIKWPLMLVIAAMLIALLYYATPNIFLLWVWISNNALLFGAEIDADLERARELQAGIEAEATLQLPPRDTARVTRRPRSAIGSSRTDAGTVRRRSGVAMRKFRGRRPTTAPMKPNSPARHATPWSLRQPQP